jgi:hypothetical protein
MILIAKGLQLLVAFILFVIAGVFGIVLLFLGAKEPFSPAMGVLDYTLDL